jgi:hypothetical protein
MDRHLDIPCIPTLDSTTNADELTSILDCKGTRGYIDTLNWQAQFHYRPLATFDIAHSGKAIYINFFAREQNIRAVNTANNSPVSEDSCVEFFVEPKGDGHYWNFEFNCIGAINASHRIERPNPTRLTDAELAQIIRHAFLGNTAFGDRTGIHTWSLLVIIPLSLIGVNYEGTPLPLRANLYKCSGKSTMPHYLTWNAIDTPKPNFHTTANFGSLTLL